jgi:hypothetical protein
MAETSIGPLEDDRLPAARTIPVRGSARCAATRNRQISDALRSVADTTAAALCAAPAAARMDAMWGVSDHPLSPRP